MRVIQLNPVAPSHYSDAEKDAWLRGYSAPTGDPEFDRTLFNPFAGDGPDELYDAWEAGWGERNDTD